MSMNENPWLQVNALQARHEIQAAWSETERRERRRLAEERQRLLLQILASPQAKSCRRQKQTAMGAA
jgi:cell division protein FtsN